jgi:dihydrofolate synthase / folylpolyglutamate synthase
VSSAAQRWSPGRAEAYLRSLELFGMRFGLDRMHRLMTVMGSPQRRFASIHVVGTNGKSSTVRMLAAILTRHGLRTGAYLSPHLASFNERVRVDERDLDEAAFAGAVERAAHAAKLVDRTLPEDDRVTQFEALTAAAYGELAARGVDVAVVEAGLGGRFDATNVIPSRVQVLTNVGLEHTRWLGPTITDIAREKLAVVRDAGTLVVGALHPDAEAEARAAAAAHGAALVHAPADAGVDLAAGGAFQRPNFALARAAAEAFLGKLDDAAVARAAAEVTIPGRFERIGEEPLTIVDGAHNPSGIAALVDSLSEVARPGSLVAVVSILDDKDAAGMLRALLPACRAVVFTSNPNPRALPPATLESLARQLGFAGETEVMGEPGRALERARGLAGAGGMVLATGSIYLVAGLARSRRAARARST